MTRVSQGTESEPVGRGRVFVNCDARSPPLSSPWLHKQVYRSRTFLLVLLPLFIIIATTSLFSFHYEDVLHLAIKDDAINGLGHDYAKYNGERGGVPFNLLTSPTYNLRSTAWEWLTMNNNPRVVLRMGLGIQDCWAFPGSSGHYGIALSHLIPISGISINHSPSAAVSSQAPRRTVLWGLAEGAQHQDRPFLGSSPRFSGDLPNSEPPNAWVDLLHFQYDARIGEHHQFFAIPAHVQKLGITFGIVVLEVLDNWGSESSTCLYRIGIYTDTNQKTF